MPEDINGLDENDIGLKMIMGDRFHDATEEKPSTEKSERKCSDTTTTKKSEQKPTNKPVDAQWEPTKERNWRDDLKDCFKSTFLFGGLNMLVWYWQVNGLMDASVAIPTMLVLAVLAGLGIGRVLGAKR